MSAALDHVFVCCSVGAPEAGALVALGLKEGSHNQHPGQGTASRRFFFENAYLELLWVSDPQEAQSEGVRATRLWDRWLNRGRSACPFGIVLRPAANAPDPDPPFPAWAYRPSYLPPEIAIHIARDTPLTEPGFFYLFFRQASARPKQPQPLTHGIPVSDVTGIEVGMPGAGRRSVAAQAVEAAGLVRFREADQFLMELTFDQGLDRGAADLRPTLPLLLRW